MAIDFSAILEAERKKALDAAAACPGSGAGSGSGSEDAAANARLSSAGVPPLPPPLASPAPPSIRYVPEFLSEADAEFLLQRLTRPAGSGAAQWVTLSKRKLMCCGGTPHPSGMFVEDLPDHVAALGRRLAKLGPAFAAGAAPNQYLINMYAPGAGISPHLDGPLYHPTAAIVSLGDVAVMDFLDVSSGSEEGKRVASVVLQPRSLLVFKDDAYNVYKHSIRDVTEWVVDDLVANAAAAGVVLGQRLCQGPGGRVSVTCRNVKRLSKRVDELVTPEDEAEHKRRQQWWHAAVNENNR